MGYKPITSLDGEDFQIKERVENVIENLTSTNMTAKTNNNLTHTNNTYAEVVKGKATSTTNKNDEPLLIIYS